MAAGTINYIGEHLLPGQIGQIAIVAGFVAGIAATIAYSFATQKRATPDYISWRNFGRTALVIQCLSVFSILGILFYIMTQQYYEYAYVQAHVSPDLPFEYIFSAFWEGQEGSFLLWMFWHAVLGLILMGTAKKWEAPTLAILAGIQVCLLSMILGIYITDDFKIGSNPLLLLRDTTDAPIFQDPEYVSKIVGRGLNPLLQNYWNVIHPPILFLGFSSTLIPFTYAIAGLWTGEHKSWLRPGLKWSLFSAGILGTGILMGGAWAYEALNFGGYWAWDPVENASLVPWLLLVAGIHTNLIAKATGRSIRTTYIFYVLTFFFVVYSTFLTRSGVLGETSVHAFTEMGMGWQLAVFLAIPLLLGMAILIAKGKYVAAPNKEEPVASREFWMFIGSLVLLFSSVLITVSTSLPIFNKIVQFFDPIYEGIVIDDPIAHYNSSQIWIAIFIGFLSGGTQYLRFKEANFPKHFARFATHIGVAALLTAGLTVLTLQWIEATAWQYILLLAAGIFTVITNLDYMISFARGNLKMAGSAISHVGFGLMIVGILASGLNKTFLSQNEFAMRGLLDDQERLKRNVLLMKGDMMPMSGYEVTYTKDTVDGFTRTFELNFKRRGDNNEVVEEFNVYPNVLYTKDFSKVAAPNPDTKHYLGKDIFTHVADLPRVELDTAFAREFEAKLRFNDYAPFLGNTFEIVDTFTISVRGEDTTIVQNYHATITDITRTPTHPDYSPMAGDVLVGATVEIQARDSVYIAEPMLALRGQYLYSFPAQINDITTKVKLGNDFIDTILDTPQEEQAYESFELAQGDQITFNGYQIRFLKYNQSPQHPDYLPSDDDIAVVGAVLQVTTPNGKTYNAEPIYWIRGRRAMNLRDHILEEGLHFRFTKIDPSTGIATLQIAQDEQPSIPIAIATNSSRTDFIVLEAIEFQGINFFWLGSIMMLIGLFFSMSVRMSQKLG